MKLKRVMICRVKIEKQRNMWHGFYIMARPAALTDGLGTKKGVKRGTYPTVKWDQIYILAPGT